MSSPKKSDPKKHKLVTTPRTTEGDGLQRVLNVGSTIIGWVPGGNEVTATWTSDPGTPKSKINRTRCSGPLGAALAAVLSRIEQASAHLEASTALSRSGKHLDTEGTLVKAQAILMGRQL